MNMSVFKRNQTQLKMSKIKVPCQTRPPHISSMPRRMMTENLLSMYYLVDTKDSLSDLCITYIIVFTPVNNLRVMITLSLKMKILRIRKTNLSKGVQQPSVETRS